MDIVLRNLIGTHCWIFIDDFIVFSNTAEEHSQRLEKVYVGSMRQNYSCILGNA